MSSQNKLAEYIFFFGLLFGASYLVWLIIAPFGTVLALAAMVVIICYPIHERILKITPRHNRTIASFFSTTAVVLIIVVPLIVLGSYIFRESVSIYTLYNSNDQAGFSTMVTNIQHTLQRYIPSFKLDVTGVVQQSASFIASHLLSIFSTTASTLFLSFLTLVSIFYLFRDGKEFTFLLMRISPLKNHRDALIMKRIGTAVRSVALGSISIAIVQGTLTAIGLSLFGFDRAILLGCIAAIGALIPNLGTAVVYIPTIIYLVIIGDTFTALGVAGWGLLLVGLIDNILSPYVMSKTNPLHPFLILLSVLGGILLLGPVGFIVGPVIMSFFAVLIELYADFMVSEKD